MTEYNDYLLGTVEGDTLFGDDGTDALLGQEGNDELDGWNGSDLLKGQDGQDTLFGYNGNDILVGGSGNDELFGEVGSDLLIGIENDIVSSGADEFDTLSGGAGGDAFVLGDRLGVFYGGDGYATITDFDYLEGDKIQVFGSASDYTLTDFAGGVDINYQGNLIGYVENTNDVVISEDFIFVDEETIDNDYLLGTLDDDTLFGDDGTDALLGQEGNDELDGWNGSDLLKGQDGQDTLFGYNGNDILVGGSGNDELFGEVGSDLLIGIENDIVSSGADEFDTLSGGAGGDAFVLGDRLGVFYGGDGYATITDFDYLEGDKIQVFGSASDYTLTDFAGGVDINYQGNLIGYVENTNNVVISEDFIFV